MFAASPQLWQPTNDRGPSSHRAHPRSAPAWRYAANTTTPRIGLAANIYYFALYRQRLELLAWGLPILTWSADTPDLAGALGTAACALWASGTRRRSRGGRRARSQYRRRTRHTRRRDPSTGIRHHRHFHRPDRPRRSPLPAPRGDLPPTQRTHPRAAGRARRRARPDHQRPPHRSGAHRRGHTPPRRPLSQPQHHRLGPLPRR